MGPLLAGALLLSEFMWIVGRFDTAALADSPEGWARLMHQA